MVNSIRDNNLINNQISPTSPIDSESLETIKQVFNEFVAFDQAVKDYDAPRARDIMQRTMEKDWDFIKEACRRAEAIDKLEPHLDEAKKSFCSRGYEGHNNLLLRAIGTADYKAFIRICMDSDDGSWRVQRDPETLRSLLHFAAAAGQGQLLYYLLLQGADVDLVDGDGLTVKQAAQKHGREDVVEFIEACQALIAYEKKPSDALKAKIALINPNLKEIVSGMADQVKEYIETYKELQASYYSEDGKLTDEGKAKKDIAKHGLVRHEESSQGHNGLIIESIIEGNVEKLAAYVKMGAPLDTLSMPLQKAVQDPQAVGAAYQEYVNESMRTFTQEMRETFLGEDPTMWDRNLGVGKSLLDLAVIYSSETQDNLEIIAYLMGKGLDPFRTNDEGDSPFSIALVKGNLKAAMLMMGYKKISEEKLPQIDEETLNKAFLILQAGSKMRDPLYVNSSKTRAGIFAAAYLLSLLAQRFDIQSSILSWINLFSFFHGNFMSDELTFREKLNIKSEKNLYLPDIIKQIYPIAYRAAVLEIAAKPQYPVGRISTTALGVYAGVMSTFSSLATAANHVAERPLSALYKVGMDILPAAQSVAIFKYYFDSLIYYPAKQWLSPQDPGDWKWTWFTRRLNSEQLDPNCREHAKIIFTANWDQAAYEKDPIDYLNGLVGSSVDSLSDAQKNKLIDAYHTLIEPENGSFLYDTAVKGGMIFGANVVNFQGWQPLQKASIFYNLGSRIVQRIIG
jgi:ankyrin repeat protein